MMNNEPVAWMDEINTFVLDKDYKQFPKSLQNGMIPLYTHPVKEQELLDEIARLGKENTKWRKWCDLLLKDIAPDDLPTCKHGVDDGACKECYIEVTHPAELTEEEITNFINAFCLDMGDYWELTEKNAIPMIRAILRKAQEK